MQHVWVTFNKNTHNTKEVKIEILDYKNLFNNAIMNKKEIYND